MSERKTKFTFQFSKRVRAFQTSREKRVKFCMQLRILSWKIYIFDQSKSLLNENHLDQNFEMSRFLDSQEFLENSREISLLDLDLEANSFHFSLSISILRNFHFTFHSRSRSQGIFISLFILEMSETDFHFTFHFSKWVNKIFISLFTSRTSNIHSRRTLQVSE